MFLQGAGKTMLAIPFLPSLFPEFAYAASTPSSLKFVQVASPQHAQRKLYWPEMYQPLAPYTQLDAAFKANSLVEIVKAKGKISDAFGTNWNALAPYMNLVVGCSMNGSNDKHNGTVPTTASSPNIATSSDGVNPAGNDPSNPYSLDWYAEKYLNQAGTPGLFPALRTYLAYRHGTSGYLHYEHPNYCYKGPRAGGRGEAVPNSEMYDVAELEAKLATAGAAVQDPRSVNRMKLIDAVQEDYQRMLNNKRISSVDKTRLSEAVDLWNSAENRRKAVSTSTCSSPLVANGPKSTDTPRQRWQIYDEYMMDMLAASLACGLTKVVTYVLSHAGDNLYQNFAEYDRLHAVQHDPSNSVVDSQAMALYRADRMAYFANRIRTLTDANGVSLLDSTLMYWGWEYAETAHNSVGTTSVLIGGAAGRLQTGLHINGLGDPSAPVNFYSVYKNLPPVNKVHVTILKAMGLTDAEIEVNGQPGFGEYGNVTSMSNDHRIAGIGFSNENRAQWYTVAEKRKPIPIIKP